MNTLKSKKILIVDDQPSMRRFVEAIFRNAGVTAFLAGENGTEALELALQESPDLIVMDMSMPNGNGLTMLRRLKQDTTTANIPVIIISAGDFRQMTDESGAVAVLVKPFTSRQLLGEAEKLLAASGALKTASSV